MWRVQSAPHSVLEEVTAECLEPEIRWRQMSTRKAVRRAISSIVLDEGRTKDEWRVVERRGRIHVLWFDRGAGEWTDCGWASVGNDVESYKPEFHWSVPINSRAQVIDRATVEMGICEGIGVSAGITQMVARCNGFRVREQGGVYAIPAGMWPRFERFIMAMEAQTATRFTVVELSDPDSLAAVVLESLELIEQEAKRAADNADAKTVADLELKAKAVARLLDGLSTSITKAQEARKVIKRVQAVAGLST